MSWAEEGMARMPKSMAPNINLDNVAKISKKIIYNQL